MKSLADTINKCIEKYMILLTPGSIILGLVLNERISMAQIFVPYLFGYMTFSGTLSITFMDLRKALQPKPLVLYLFLSHVIFPLVVYTFSAIVFGFASDYTIGFVLIYATPCAIVSCVWAGMYNNDKPLSVAVVIIDTLLAFVLTPLTVRVFCGASIEVDMTGMIFNILVMVVIPAILGMSVSVMVKQRIQTVLPYTKLIAKLVLVFVVMTSVSKVAKQLMVQASWTYVSIALVSLVMFWVSYSVAIITAKRFLRNHKPQVVSLAFACGMKNVSMGLVLAAAFFPPLVSIPIIITMTIQDFAGSAAGTYLSKKE